jgi:hypothetical protein
LGACPIRPWRTAAPQWRRKSRREAVEGVEAVSEHYVDHSPATLPRAGTRRNGVKQGVEIFATAQARGHHIDGQVAEGDRVVTRLTAHDIREDDSPASRRTACLCE